jgi:glycosyltransferase involved in cell wall biosynthesis
MKSARRRERSEARGEPGDPAVSAALIRYISRPLTIPPYARTRVCFVASNTQLGGAETYLASLLTALGPSSVATVVLLDAGPFAAHLRGLGIPAEVVPCNGRRGLLPAALRVRRLVRECSPDLIHANGVKAALVSALAMTGEGTPIVWHKHDSARDGRIGRWLARRCRLVVGVSKSSVASLDGAPDVLTTVVPNGIPVYSIDRAKSRELVLRATDADMQGPLIGMVGRLHPRKGQLELVEIGHELLERLPCLHLLLAGASDPYEPDFLPLIEQRVRELAMEPHVTLLGFRPDAVELIAGCDLLAMPSTQDPSSGWREGFPLAPLEAMSVGTPVVGYAEPGIAEVTGGCAELVRPGDREGLRDAIARVAGDASVRNRMSACGRERASGYELSHAAQRMREIYASVAEGTDAAPTSARSGP